MANAIINGIIKSKTFPANRLYIFDRHQEKCTKMSTDMGIHPLACAKELAQACDVIFLAVKPQNFSEVLSSISCAVDESKLIVSIAAGISCEYVAKHLNCNCPVIRTMPNTPLLIGKGATAMCRTSNVSDERFLFVQSLFAACGTVAVLQENQMNAVISVSGSSPAYIYLFAKAMIDGAVQQGIDAQTALGLICQTLEGGAEMLLSSGFSPDELIKMVSSRGGTTVEALAVFNQHNFEQIVLDAMLACTKKAKELGK